MDLLQTLHSFVRIRRRQRSKQQERIIVAFINQRLDMSTDLNSQGSIGFNTEVISSGQGLETRQAYWQEDLGTWQTGQRRIRLERHNYLLGFFRLMKGRLNTFRYKDWLEWMANGQVLGSGDGVEVDFQLKLTPYSGAMKTIYLPIADTVVVYFDSVEQLSSTYTTSETSGIVTFNSPPPDTTVIQADFHFDKHCRFDTDSYQAQFEAKRVDDSEMFYALGSLPIKELREAPQP